LAFDDIEVSVRAKADTTELRNAIKDFDGTAEAVERLKNATNDVKSSMQAQNLAIRALNTANRVQNFQLIETLRFVRFATSAFRSLNQVYQTLLLRSIDTNQVTVAQAQAFEKATDQADAFTRALDILGPSNQEVKDSLDDLIARADQLNSTQLKELIQRMRDYGSSANFSEAEQTKFNEALNKLNKLLQETKAEESAKGFEDLFGTIALGGTAIGTLGQLVLKLGRYRAALAGLARFAPALVKGGAIATAILFLTDLLGKQTAGEEELPTGFDVITKGPPAPKGGLEDFLNRLGPPGPAPATPTKIEVNFNNPSFSSYIDIEKAIDTIDKKLMEKYGRRFQ